MKAIIMAAGKGTRLAPLTDTQPKCMVKVKEIPMIIRTINTLINGVGIPISDIIVITGYMQGIIHQYCALMASKGLTFITQFRADGTANAINLAKKHIKEDFLVLSGDIVYNKCDLMKLRQLKNSILYTKQDEKLYEYGTLDICGDKIKAIHEKSTEPTSHFVNCGTYHFTPEVFDYIPKTSVDERFNERIITNTINLMIKDGIEFTGIRVKELNEITYPEDIEKVEVRI